MNWLRNGIFALTLSAVAAINVQAHDVKVREFDLSVRVPGVCAAANLRSSFGLDEIVARSGFASSGIAVLDFKVSCNAPITYRLRSRFGGFRSGDFEESSAVGQLPYSIRVVFAQEALTNVRAGCPSIAFGDEGLGCSLYGDDDAIAFREGAKLIFEWRDVDGAAREDYLNDYLTLILELKL